MLTLRISANEFKYVPSYHNNYEKVTFEKWWNQIVFFHKPALVSFCRSDIIRSVADMDGGAHVDTKMKESYYNFSRNQIPVWIKSNGEKPTNSPALSLIRQFVYEINKSLEDQTDIWDTTNYLNPQTQRSTA